MTRNILLDDVQFKTKEGFFDYMTRTFGLEEGAIKNGDDLRRVIEESEDQLDFAVYDMDDITPDREDFAAQMMDIIMDCREKNKDRITVKLRDGMEGI